MKDEKEASSMSTSLFFSFFFYLLQHGTVFKAFCQSPLRNRGRGEEAEEKKAVVDNISARFNTFP